MPHAAISNKRLVDCKPILMRMGFLYELPIIKELYMLMPCRIAETCVYTKEYRKDNLYYGE